jgi:hypothetical protein
MESSGCPQRAPWTMSGGIFGYHTWEGGNAPCVWWVGDRRVDEHPQGSSHSEQLPGSKCHWCQGEKPGNRQIHHLSCTPYPGHTHTHTHTHKHIRTYIYIHAHMPPMCTHAPHSQTHTHRCQHVGLPPGEESAWIMIILAIDLEYHMQDIVFYNHFSYLHSSPASQEAFPIWLMEKETETRGHMASSSKGLARIQNSALYTWSHGSDSDDSGFFLSFYFSSSLPASLPPFLPSFLSFWGRVLGIEPRAWSLLGKHFTTWATPLVLLFVLCF